MLLALEELNSVFPLDPKSRKPHTWALAPAPPSITTISASILGQRFPTRKSRKRSRISWWHSVFKTRRLPRGQFSEVSYLPVGFKEAPWLPSCGSHPPFPHTLKSFFQSHMRQWDPFPFPKTASRNPRRKSRALAHAAHLALSCDNLCFPSKLFSLSGNELIVN